MKIYTFWNSTASATDDQAQLLRLWERSWTAHGWEPRLLTVFNSKRSKLFQPSGNVFDLMFFALHAVGGGWLTLPTVLNAGLKPHRPKQGLLIDPWTMVWANFRKVGKFVTHEDIDVQYFPIDVLNQRKVVDSVAEALESGLCR